MVLEIVIVKEPKKLLVFNFYWFLTGFEGFNWTKLVPGSRLNQPIQSNFKNYGCNNYS